MNILMFGQKTIPSRDGGVEIVVEELASRLAKTNNVTVFNRKRTGVKSPKTYKNIHLKDVFTIDKKSLDAIVYAFFSTLKARSKKYDVVHIHAEGPCFFLWMLGKHKNKKVVVTIHGLDWQRGKWGGLASKILKVGEKQAVKHADEIIVLSKGVQEYFLKTYNRKTTFIPNGVNKPELLAPNIIKNEYNLDKDSYVLFLARIVPEKGLDYLIDAWNSMSNVEKNGKKLVIAGGSSHSDSYYESICNKCKNDKTIIMTGFVTGNKLVELFSNAYLYILPSDVEGMPISLLEAMSFGNRCLVSDITENSDVIRNDYDVTFKKGDVVDLKNKMVKLIQINFSSHQNQYIYKTWEDVTNETITLYRGCK